MTKLAEIMNDFYATEELTVEELIDDATTMLSHGELAEELIKLIYHLDGVIE